MTFTPAERQAIDYIALLIEIYGRGQGTGLLSGPERYSVLEARLRLEATRADSLRNLWDRLCRSLQLPIQATARDPDVIALWQGGNDLAVLRLLSENATSIVTLARVQYQQRQKPEAA